MKNKAIFLSLAIFSFANAVTIYPTVSYGGKNLGEMLIKVEDGKYIVDNTLSFGKCKSNVLNDFGTINYDEDKETLSIKPFKECLDRKEISYYKKQKLKFVDTKSFYLNYSYTQDNFDNKSLNLQAGVFAFDTFLYSDFYTFFKGKTYRNQTYLLKDFTSIASRLKIGDSFSRTYMLTNGDRLFGVSFYRDTSVNPNFKLYKTFQQDITITAPSIVEIYSNGTLIDRKELPAGIYSFKDLPVKAFNNNVEIKIIDKATLKENVIQIPFIFAPNVLKKGLWDYSISFGLKRKNENTYKDLGYGGYLRYGLLENLTTGISFDDKKTAFHIDYSNFFGNFTAGINTDRKYLIAYNYSNNYFSFGTSYQEKDFRAFVSKSFNKWGNFTIQYHKNGTEEIGFLYTNNIWKGSLNFSAFRRNNDYQIRVSYTIPFGKRPNIFALNQYLKEKEKQTSIRYSYAFKETQEKSFGTDLSYTFIDRDKIKDTNQYNLTFNAKYINLFRLNAFKTDDTKANYNFTVSGSFACVGLTCRFGEPITYGAFAVGNHLDTGYRKAYGVVNLIPYYYSKITDERNDYTSITEKLTAKFGQGVNLAEKKIVKATLYYNGKPLKLTDLKVNGEDNFTGKNGEIIIETARDTVEIELFGKKYTANIKDKKIKIND
jgi:outer membrane usher protein FimD/PapC